MRIHGVRLIEIPPNLDHRGSLSTVHRDTQAGPFAQWNCIRSDANVLRGLHAHRDYDELYVPIRGRMFLLLKDARSSSPSSGAEIGFWSEEIEDKSIFVPSGVAHGVYFATDGILLYGLSRIWTGAGELECRWDDAEISTRWPARDPILSDKDTAAGSFAAMVTALERSPEPADA